MLRTFCSAPGDAYHPFVFISLSSRKAGLACRTSGGRLGQAGGPPVRLTSTPDTARRASRNCSALSRRKGGREYSVIGSAWTASGGATLVGFKDIAKRSCALECVKPGGLEIFGMELCR